MYLLLCSTWVTETLSSFWQDSKGYVTCLLILFLFFYFFLGKELNEVHMPVNNSRWKALKKVIKPFIVFIFYLMQ